MKFVHAAVFMLLATVLSSCARETVRLTEPIYNRYDPLFIRSAGDHAWLYGSIKTSSPEVVQDYLVAHPQTTTFVFRDMPGSSDDQAALEIADLIRMNGIETHMPADAKIESGAVMVFAAGATRTAKCGAAAGVHAWWDTAGYSAQDVPPEHPGHAHFIDYYKRMGLSDAYYWFAMNAAPPDGMHILTPEELNSFGLVTHPVRCGDP